MTFSGYGSPGRFQDSNLSRAGSERILERERNKRQLDNIGSKLKLSQDAAIEAEMQRSAKISQEIRSRQFDQQTLERKNRIEADKRNHKVETDNLVRQAEAQEGLFQQLQKFSTTAAEGLTGLAKKQKKEKEEEEWAEGFLSQWPSLTSEELFIGQNSESELEATSGAFEFQADEMRSQGKPELMAKRVRDQAGWKSVYAMKGQLDALAGTIPSMLMDNRDTPVDLGDGNEITIRQAMQQGNWDQVDAIRRLMVTNLAKPFFDKGVSKYILVKNFFEPAASSINTLRSEDLNIREKNARLQLQNDRFTATALTLDSPTHGAKSFSILLNTQYGQNRAKGMNEIFSNVITRLNNGSIPGSEAVAYVNKLLDEQTMPMGPGGTEIPLREALTQNSDVADMIKAAENAERLGIQNQQRDGKADMSFLTMQALSMAKEGGTTENELNMLDERITELALKNNIDPSKYRNLIDSLRDTTIESINEGEAENGLEESFRNLDLTVDDVMNSGLSSDSQSKWLRKADLVSRLTETKLDGKSFEAAAKAELRSALGSENIATREVHFSLQGALSESKRLYHQQFQLNVQQMPEEEAAQKAYDTVMAQIQKRAGAFTVTPGTQNKDGDNRSYFNKFTPGNHAFAPIYEARRDLSPEFQTFAFEPEKLSEKNYYDLTELGKINANLKAGRRVKIPGYFKAVEEATGIDAEEALNMQLKQAGYSTEVAPGGLSTLKKEVKDTPGFKNFFDRFFLFFKRFF